MTDQQPPAHVSPRHVLPARTAVALCLAAAALLPAGCSSNRPGTPARTDVTATVARNGVQVTAVVSSSTVRVTYRPQRPGFHLYSSSLPAAGVDGLGVPTLLGVRGGLRATGPATADRPVRALHLASLDVTLPVYPDGPVTLTLPVARTGPSPAAQVVVSYGACSAATCLLPVRDLTLAVRIP